MDPGVSVQKNKTSQETQRSLQKFLESERKPKVIYTDNSLEFGKACEDISWNHCTSTPHRSETNGIAERAVRRVKEGTSAVLLQSGLNESWWADSMECYTYLRNVTDLLSDGKTPYERRFGKPFEGPINPFGSLVEYHPITAKDQSRIHQFGKKVLPGLFLGYALYAGWIWKGDVLIEDLEELETMDASEIYSKRLNAKEVIFHKEKGELVFQSQVDESKPLEEIRIWEHPPVYGIDQFKEMVTLTFLENQKGLFHNLTTHFRMPVKRWMIFGPCQESSKTAITLFPVPLKYIDVSRTTHTNLDVKQEKRIDDYWNIDGSRDLSDPWTVSQHLLCWKKNLPTDKCGLGGDYRENSRHPGQVIYGENSGSQWESMPSWRRSRSGLMRSSILKTHENCEGSISSTRRLRNSKKPSRMRLRSWKQQWLLLCRVKLWKKNCGSGGSNKVKNKTCVYSGSWWIYETAYGKFDTALSSRPYCRKRRNSLQHYNLVHKFIPMPQAMKIPAAKAAVDKEWEKLVKFRRWTWQKSKVRKRWSMKQGRRALQLVRFASLMDICHLKNAELEAKHQKYKGRVVLRGDIVKDDSGSYAVFTEQGSSASQMTGAKIIDIISRLPGFDGQAADAVSAFSQVKMEDAHKLFKKFQNRSVQTFGFVYHDTNGPNHGPAWKTQLFLLKGSCMVILWQDCYGKGNLRKSYWNMAGRKFQIGNVSLYIVKKDYSYLCM